MNNAVCGNSKVCKNESPLLIAISYDHSDIALWMIQHGADIHKATHNQFTALHCAIKKQNMAVTKCLVESGVNINFPDKTKWLPLH